MTIIEQTVTDQATDEAIVKAIAAREQTALSELYTRYASLLMGTAYRILQNRNDAEDLVHDVYLEVWNKAGNFDASRGKVKTWLVLITRSRALDRLRVMAKAREHAMVAQTMDAPTPPSTNPDQSMEHRLVRTAVDALEEAQRKVLYLNYFEGLSCQEIATRLGIPLGTIKSRLRAAVKNLKNTFQASEQRV